jgi:hypothetical protein
MLCVDTTDLPGGSRAGLLRDQCCEAFCGLLCGYSIVVVFHAVAIIYMHMTAAQRAESPGVPSSSLAISSE